MESKMVSQSDSMFAGRNVSDIYRELIEEEQDIFFSPVSIQITCLLLYAGACGKAAEEIATALRLMREKHEIMENVAALLRSIEDSKLTIASEAFIEQSFRIKNDFKSYLQKFFFSNCQEIDCTQTAENSREAINTKISELTKHKIRNVIPPGLLNEATKLVLVNVVHFKDNWKEPFEIENTFEEPFFTSENNFVNVEMMHTTKKFNYVEKEFFKILQLPYEDSRFKMVVFLPNDVKDLHKLEFELGDVNFSKLFSEMFLAKVRLSFPKFKLEKLIDMKKVLKSLGMRTMFEETADFSEIYYSGECPLYVSDILHKAVVEVNEEGSEAAAASVAHIRKRKSLMPEEIIYDFEANHSFIFYIFFEDIVLFVGKKNSIF